MANKINILLSGLGGSLFPYLDSKLVEKFNTFYLDADKEIKMVYKDKNFFLSPLVNDSYYLNFLSEVIKENKIDFYIPLIDEELLKTKNELNNICDVGIISPGYDFIKLCLNKYNLMKTLKNMRVSNLNSFRGDEFNNQIDFPLFLKPIIGRGSRGIFKVTNTKQFEAYFQLFDYNKNEILVQPFINGIEYTVGVLCNSNNDIISISSKRIIRKKGITQIAITENNLLIDKVVNKIVDAFKPSGPFNVQLFLDSNGTIFIFEINPRFSTTSILEYEGGLDLISLYIKYYNKNYMGDLLRPNENLRIHRRWESLFYYE